MTWTDRLLNFLTPTRNPDVIIGEHGDPYLHRWWLIPRNRFFNVYLHHFLRSDDDRALHDHPWWNMSLLLRGSYDEVVPGTSCHPSSWSYQVFALTQVTDTIRRRKGFIVLRHPKAAHRIKLLPDNNGGEKDVWTLFITGPRLRDWGFWCKFGWRHWKDFVHKEGSLNTTGRGCD